MSAPRKRPARDRFEQTVQHGAAEVARRVADAGPRYASPEDALDMSRDWSDEQLICRTKGHRFVVPIDVTHYTRYRYYFVRLGCAGGCGVVQEQELNERGHVYWSAPRYPPGYLSKHGRIAGDAKDAVRLETVLRVFKPSTSRKQSAEPHSGWDEAVNGPAEDSGSDSGREAS